jgi:hypothetical protein
MTAKEAIEVLKANYPDACFEQLREAVDMAISALKQPEIIWCEDCEHVRKWRDEESAKKFGQVYECVRGVFDCPNTYDFCSKAERRKNQRGKVMND